MNKKLILLLVFIVPMVNFGQDYSALWTGYFSYNNIVDVAQSSTTIYAAAENAIFSYDITTQEVDELTTINGLSGETITAIHYSETYQLMLIGYESGLIEVAFDNDIEILSVVDIIEKTTIQPLSKRINPVSYTHLTLPTTSRV